MPYIPTSKVGGFTAHLVNQNEQITIADANLVRSYLLGTATCLQGKKQLADMNGDGGITMADVLAINQSVASMAKERGRVMKSVFQLFSVIAVVSLIVCLFCVSSLSGNAELGEESEADTSADVSDTSEISTDPVAEILYGDVNGDGSIDLKDVLALRKCVAGFDAPFIFENADVTVDKQVDLKDCLIIRRYLAGMQDRLGVRLMDKLVASPYTKSVSDKMWEADNRLIQYMAEKKQDTNFVVSPYSLNYTMAMSALGANGKTYSQIMDLYGLDSLNDFYSYTQSVAELAEKLNSTPYTAFTQANSVWAGEPNSFRDEYVSAIQNYFDGDAFFVNPADFMSKANEWVFDKTNGKIPSLISEEPENMDFALINALFLQDYWSLIFQPDDVKKDVFTTSKGEETEKEYMFKIDTLKYYQDEEAELAIMDSVRGIHFAFVLGNCDDLYSKIGLAEEYTVKITVPMFEVHSKYDTADFLSYFGNLDMFTKNADFSNMSVAKGPVTNMSQQANLSIYQLGFTASASTSNMGYGGIAPKEEKIFTADKPFQFIVYTDDGNGSYCTLFYGQINE